MRFIAALWRSEGAQTSTEYIILLSTVVIFFMMLVKILKPIYSRVVQVISNNVKNSIGGANLYSFPLGK